MNNGYLFTYYYSVMNMRKIDFKKLAIYIAVPLLLGAVVGLITSRQSANYDGPVPGWIFPVVWSILYILMGISSYLISGNKDLLKIYYLNLGVNLLWPIIFFSFGFKTFAFFWLLFLIVIVGIMMYKFYKENKLATYLLIPYMIWLVFAAFLNLAAIR